MADRAQASRTPAPSFEKKARTRKIYRGWRLWAVIVVLAVPAAIGLSGLLVSADPLGDEIRKLGFNPILLPNRIHNPGSLLRVRPNGTVEAIVCQAPTQMVQEYSLTSSTPNFDTSGLTQSSYSFQSSIISQINGMLKSDVVQSVNFKLQNVMIWEIPDDKLYLILQEMLKSGPCLAQVTELVGINEFVCQASAVMQASVDYSISYKTTVEGSGQVQEPSRIVDAVNKVIPTTNIGNVQQGQAPPPAASSVGSTQDTNVVSSRGEDLNYGIKLRPLCVTVANGPPKVLPGNWVGRKWFALKRLLSAGP